MAASENSRRAFLSGLFSPLKAVAKVPEGEAQADRQREEARRAALNAPPPQPETTALEDFVAVVQGRHCIASTGFCRTCHERCPVPGAIEMDHGVPMVVAANCTGCRICLDVCPAPTNAILMVRRRPGQPRPPHPVQHE